MSAACPPATDPSGLWVAPWSVDGHPDHEAAGLASERAAGAAGVPLLRYPIWLWHWGRPDTALLWDPCRRHGLDAADRRAKRRALEAFASQLPTAGAGGILTPSVPAHFERDVEVFVT